jgi:translation initiation factor IF-1
VVQVIDAHTCVAELPNGKQVHAHFPRRRPAEDLQPGDSVSLEMNPYDFSRARIIPRNTD